MFFLFLLTAAVCLPAGCRCSSSSTSATAPNASSPTPADAQAALIKRGKTVYAGNCIACHNVNPKLAGSVGPEIFGSSLELLTARVIKGGYPEGYQPKRPGAGMPVFPHLEREIEALHAFLNAPSNP
jgi:mono/diheme cytochrome c family protein